MHDLDPRVAPGVGHERDRTPVGRPPRHRRVVLAVSELERRLTVLRREPELVPLPADVRAVYHPPAVARPVGISPPGGLLRVNLTQGRARLGGDAPDGARAP